MNALTVAALLAVAASIVALVSGIVSMTNDGGIGHKTSAQWMNWRVVVQLAVFVIVLVAILTPQ